MGERRQSDGESGDQNHEDSLAIPNTDPQRPVFAEDGTDLTLIRQSLAMTPEERIRALEAAIRSISRLRDAIDT